MSRILIHFARYGPYHHARLDSASKVLTPLDWEAIGLETAGTDSTYAWDRTPEYGAGPRVVTAFPGRVHEQIQAKENTEVFPPLLDELKPNAVAIAGWGSADARACLDWCKHRNRTAIVMSETREADGKRVWWKERIKSHIVQRFDGALIGGKSHRDYLIKLGTPEKSVRFGYNVVDNAYFATEAQKHRNSEIPKNRQYFLASNRFIERKNLARLVDAYHRYTENPKLRSPEPTTWDLCLLGDGELKQSLVVRCREVGLRVVESAPWESDGNSEKPKNQNTVFFPGFRQIDELPRFYAHAGCFVHPALEEPWGLVINEAMACGLPILSGTNVGAAEELIDEGVNGWTFEASDVRAMAEALGKIAALSEEDRGKLGAASARILEERCPTEAFGRGLAELLHDLNLAEDLYSSRHLKPNAD